MDSAALLDLLGNENRRRILRLLARRPYYVTELSEVLDVSPKAIIDHLRKLEDAGLVASTDRDDRRKYFRIERSVRLEVALSPYAYRTRSAYPTDQGPDTTYRHVSVDVPDAGGEPDPASIGADLRRLRELERELSQAQRWVQKRMTDVLQAVDRDVAGGERRAYVEVLTALDRDGRTVEELADAVGAPEGAVAEVLQDLSERGLVVHDDDRWRLPD